jgi:hypothetical protein
MYKYSAVLYYTVLCCTIFVSNLLYSTFVTELLVDEIESASSNILIAQHDRMQRAKSRQCKWMKRQGQQAEATTPRVTYDITVLHENDWNRNGYVRKLLKLLTILYCTEHWWYVIIAEYIFFGYLHNSYTLCLNLLYCTVLSDTISCEHMNPHA